jgi:glycosyltransferase involved in cell wall biosynthesis
MFGWEFPPHISGGLGTACAGLTHALEREHVEVLFAVPKLHGGETAERTRFISASHIPILQEQTLSSKAANSPLSNTKSTNKKSKSKLKRSLQYIEVAANLSPYTSVSESQQPYGLQHWNYTFQNPDDRSIPAGLKASVAGTTLAADDIELVKKPYTFSGTYGPNLLEEVHRYAQAGGEIARQHAFDVIHAHDWMTYPAGWSAKKISGKPLIVHVHATEIDRSGKHVNPEIFAIEKAGMMRADKVVTVSHWTKNIAIEYYGIDADKIEVVHNGISPKSESSSHVFSPALGAPIVTFLGRITHQKGPMYFVEAARRVHEQFPDAHFVVAGSGDQLPMMIERIAQVRLSQNFHFTGFLRGSDIERIWSMSQVYVMPSVSEPFGIAPLEAIQAGVPVIISKQAGVSEVMQHAIKVDFWNTEALAEAICNLLRFKSLANTLKKNGAEQIKSITWDKAAKKLTTLYYELSARHEKREEYRILLSGSSTKKAKDLTIF